MTNTIIAGVVLAFALVLGATYGARHAEPECPTEDSCAVDYHDGQWHIEEVTP